MIMTQFIDLKMKNSGKLEEIKPRTDSGRHRYMEMENMQTGEALCHPSLLVQEQVPSEVDTLTVRADMFMASNMSLGRDVTV